MGNAKDHRAEAAGFHRLQATAESRAVADAIRFAPRDVALGTTQRFPRPDHPFPFQSHERTCEKSDALRPYDYAMWTRKAQFRLVSRKFQVPSSKFRTQKTESSRAIL